MVQQEGHSVSRNSGWGDMFTAAVDTSSSLLEECVASLQILELVPAHPEWPEPQRKPKPDNEQSSQNEKPQTDYNRSAGSYKNCRLACWCDRIGVRHRHSIPLRYETKRPIERLVSVRLLSFR
jgi:hypothetical protein